MTGTGANPAGAADFVGNALPSGTLSFAVGETSKTITINVQGDTIVETHEAFTVTLSSPTNGAQITVASASSTITSDDLQVLNAGDVVITGFNATDPDEFSFVPLVALAPFTEIRFTDNGWLSAGGFRTGEGCCSTRLQALVSQPARKSVSPIPLDRTTHCCSGTQGSVVLESGSFAMNSGGESLTAFQGLLTSPTPIFAITNNRATFDANAIDSVHQRCQQV